MDQSIDVPFLALRYILLQRTFYQSQVLRRLLRYSPGVLGTIFLQLESLARKRYIFERYQRGLRAELESMKNGLPERITNLLDIGCGIAGFDVLLYRYYENTGAPDLYLLDYSTISADIQYGYSWTPSRYNSLEIARELLTKNSIPESKINFVEPSAIGDLNLRGEIDLIISILAWGFHFPIETYLDQVVHLLHYGSKLIVDVRKGTAGIDVLRKRFAKIEILKEDDIRQRVLAAEVSMP